MPTYDYEDDLFSISPKPQILHKLKELYISFNDKHSGLTIQAREKNQKAN